MGTSRQQTSGSNTEGADEPRRDQPGAEPGFDYADYEFSLRDRQWNREMLAPCVPYLCQCRNVLDLACGPGVLLELLAEHGVRALGVERNARVAAWVQARGGRVVCQDAFEFLATVQETFDGAVCSHLLEHLPFEQVLRLIELLVRRLEAHGTLVIILPNPESVRMQLFGFWRDPEHVRFYHPELIEQVCRHYGLDVVHSNRQEQPFALAPPARPAVERPTGQASHAQLTWWRRAVRVSYSRVLRALRLASRADLAALEAEVRREHAAFEEALVGWAEHATWAVNRMWAWPDNALIVCRKRA